MAKKTQFFKQKSIAGEMKKLFRKEKKELQELMPWAIIEHVGGTSIPGAITKRELDIQIRVKKKDFKQACLLTSLFYRKHHEEIWRDTFAIFVKVDAGTDCPIDYMITIIDSLHDHHYKVRDYMIENPYLIGEYNDLKQSYSGKEYTDYVKAKQNFFLDKSDVMEFLRFLKEQ